MTEMKISVPQNDAHAFILTFRLIIPSHHDDSLYMHCVCLY